MDYIGIPFPHSLLSPSKTRNPKPVIINTSKIISTIMLIGTFITWNYEFSQHHTIVQ